MLSDLAPARNSGWLLGLQRADPSAPLDECGSFFGCGAHCAVLDQEMQEGHLSTPWHSNRAGDESDLAARAFIVTRSLARDGMPGRPREQMPPPDPREVRQRGSGAWSGEGLLRSRGRRCGSIAKNTAGRGWALRLGRSITGRSASARSGPRAPPPWRPSGDGRGSSHADPAIPRPPPSSGSSPFSRLVVQVSGLGSAFLPSATASRWPRMGRRWAIR